VKPYGLIVVAFRGVPGIWNGFSTVWKNFCGQRCRGIQKLQLIYYSYLIVARKIIHQQVQNAKYPWRGSPGVS
jgi:hypothetical protein